MSRTFHPSAFKNSVEFSPLGSVSGLQQCSINIYPPHNKHDDIPKSEEGRKIFPGMQFNRLDDLEQDVQYWIIEPRGRKDSDAVLRECSPVSGKLRAGTVTGEA